MCENECGKRGRRGYFYLRRVSLFSSEGGGRSFRETGAPVLETEAATDGRKSPPDSEFSPGSVSRTADVQSPATITAPPPAISMFINTGLANKLQPCMWRLRSADRRAHAEQPRSSYAVSPGVRAGRKTPTSLVTFSAQQLGVNEP